MINKLEPGDRQLSASSWNEMRDKVNNITPSQDTVLMGNRNPFLVTVKNNTGSALPALSVVKLTTPLYSRNGDTFVNKSVEFGVEMNADVPDSETNIVGVTQSACPVGGMVKAIVSGPTPVLEATIGTLPDHPYQYAEVVPGVTSYLKGTDKVTNIRLISYTGGTTTTPGGGYAILDWVDDRERFQINCTATNGYASIAKKGAVFPITWSNTASGWVVFTRNNSSKYVLAVCQEDIPDDFLGTFYMPFYTPEQNYGIRPALANAVTTSSYSSVGRIGVGTGDNAFSNKRLNYAYQHGQYSYEPSFTYTGPAVNAGDASNPSVGIVLGGHTYVVTFPYRSTGGGDPLMAPDIYAGDIITVHVEEADSADYGASVRAIDYPTDFKSGTSLVVENSMLLSRGWDEEYIPGTNFKYIFKDKAGALI